MKVREVEKYFISISSLYLCVSENAGCQKIENQSAEIFLTAGYIARTYGNHQGHYSGSQSGEVHLKSACFNIKDLCVLQLTGKGYINLDDKFRFQHRNAEVLNKVFLI